MAFTLWMVPVVRYTPNFLYGTTERPARMTRSAEEAIDETQAKLGQSCERLLASSAWNRAHTSTQKGLPREGGRYV